MKLYEVVGYSVSEKDFGKQESFFLNGEGSMIDFQRTLGNKDYELDELTTLELYLDHDWIGNHKLYILNEIKVMGSAFDNLISDYNIYDIVKKVKYNEIGGITNG